VDIEELRSVHNKKKVQQKFIVEPSAAVMILKSKLDKQAGAKDQSFLIEKLKQQT
jgi:hypothetical protein